MFLGKRGLVWLAGCDKQGQVHPCDLLSLLKRFSTCLATTCFMCQITVHWIWLHRLEKMDERNDHKRLMVLKQPPLLKGGIMYVAAGSMLRSCVMQGGTTDDFKRRKLVDI